MENGQNGSGSMLDVSLVSSLDQNELKSLQDVMVRRMKNRERQRRYRARKRLEADRKKTDDPQQLPQPEGHTAKEITPMPLPRRKKEYNSIVPFTQTRIELPLTIASTPVNFVARVHSQRDWKRDARRAHLIREQNGNDCSSSVVPLATPSSGSQAQSSSFGTRDQPSEDQSQSSSAIPDNIQERSVLLGRRNWKEEARNKKS